MSCFKTYDIRGLVPSQLNEEIAETIGMAFAHITGATRVAVGHDPRLSSPRLTRALSRGLVRAGLQVHYLGLCGTEEAYFASCLPRFDAAIMVTASHNPSEYNGMKMVLKKARPLSPEQFAYLRQLTESGFSTEKVGGEEHLGSVRQEYFSYLSKVIGTPSQRRLKVVCNPGNGGASVAFPLLRDFFEVVALNARPNGHFPNGVPNPMIPESRVCTTEVVQAEGAHFGVAWDGDFDRCFLFDEKGAFVENYHLTALLSAYFLTREPEAKIIHDPRLTWCVEREVKALGGHPICAKTGHVNLKAQMKAQDAIYGGEMSGHHYFKDLYGFDSGLLPALLVSQILARSQHTLSELLRPLRDEYKVSGEINFRVADVQLVLEAIEREMSSQALTVSKMDGLSMEFSDWRFNVRSSNTEPLLRLNVEAIKSERKVKSAVLQLRQIIESVNRRAETVSFPKAA